MPLDIPSTITAMATLLTSVGALIYAIRGDRNSRRNTVLGEHNATGIAEIRTATDGMKTELVNEVRAAATAKGELKGAADEKSKHEG